MQHLPSRWLAVFGTAIGAILSSGWASSESVADEPAVLKAVQARVDAYTRTWNTHDAGSVAAFFTDDADMVMGNAPRVAGRTAIQSWWSKYFRAIDERRTGTFTIESLRLIAPDVALVNVKSRTGGREGKGDELPTRLARGTWIVVRRDGQWLISALRGLPAEGDVRSSPGTDR